MAKVAEKQLTVPSEAEEAVAVLETVDTIHVGIKRNIYCLLINEEVMSGSNAPVGGWFVQYINFSTQQVWGPMPIMTSTRKGQAQVSGFVRLEDLRPMVEFQWEHELEHGKVTHPGQGLDLSSGSNKMMSCWIAA